MQLPITIILATLSAGALALPTETTDGPMPAAQTPNTRNGLPYSNFDPYSHTLPYNSDTLDNHTANGTGHHHHRRHHQHNTSGIGKPTALFRRKSGSFGDIASYSDGLCTVNVTAKVSLSDSVCAKFAPVEGTNIGINWGSSIDRMHRLQPYTGKNCDTQILKGPIVAPANINMRAKGAGTCTPYHDYLMQGKQWESVWGT